MAVNSSPIVGGGSQTGKSAVVVNIFFINQVKKTLCHFGIIKSVNLLPVPCFDLLRRLDKLIGNLYVGIKGRSAIGNNKLSGFFIYITLPGGKPSLHHKFDPS